MKIAIDSKIGDTGNWADSVRRASGILEMVLDTGSVASSIILANATAHWDLVKDQRGGPQISLALSDPFVSVEERFRPEDLADSERLWSRLRSFWGDFLRARADKHLERLREPEESSARID